MRKETIKKNINFYELQFFLNGDYELPKSFETPIMALLSMITRIAREKRDIRYLNANERKLFINEINFDTSAVSEGKRIVKGKLLSVRKDFFPMLLNTNTDKERDIDALEDEGIVETTHFIIQETNKNKTDKVKVCLEHNQFGAKIGDLVYYLEQIGRYLGIVDGIQATFLQRNALKAYQNRMGQVAKIHIKVNKDDIPALRRVTDGGGLFQSAEAAREYFQQDDLVIELSYNIYQQRDNPNSGPAMASRSFTQKMLKHLIDHPGDARLFEHFVIKAEDSEKADQLNSFDLLINKIKDTITVEKRPKFRTIISLDMFEKMIDSWNRLKIKVS
jgi:hypothetical protein